MPATGIDAVEAIFEAFNSKDLERILALADPGFEAVVPPELSAEPDTYRGHAGIRRYFAAFEEAMDEVSFLPERWWEADDATVVAVRMRARGRQTEIPVEQRFIQVWRLRAGRALRVTTHASLADALAEAGLTAAQESRAGSPAGRPRGEEPV